MRISTATPTGSGVQPAPLSRGSDPRKGGVIRIPFPSSLVLLFVTCLQAQTTQGLIHGRLVNSVNGRPIPQAVVICLRQDVSAPAQALSDSDGFFYLPLLSPGMYRVAANASGYQAEEVQELTLPVAGQIELDLRLRPLSDVFEAGQYRSVFLPGSRTIVTFFGPDVDSSRTGSFQAQEGRIEALESTVSDVVDSAEIDRLPLAGRDVYTMLVLQPGVTSGGATARGLGLSINGQRPSASNFLLDGLENNNYLITGPLATVAPEVIQEYRVSVNNFSAEYGRTSGFLANAISRAGTDAFHGSVYLYLKNDILNANGFQANLQGMFRRPYKELQPGYIVGGPIWKSRRLNFSSALERFRSRSFQDPLIFEFPTPDLLLGVPPNARVSKLLKDFPPPPGVKPLSGLYSGTLNVAAPISIDRALSIERADYNSAAGRDRVLGRVVIQRLTRPDFIYTPYPGFSSPLHQNTIAPGVTYTHLFSPALTNEARAGYSDDDLFWTRAHPEIPTLSAGSEYHLPVALPGSPAFYEYKNRNRSLEFLDNLLYFHGRHLITTGGGALLRGSDGYLTAGRDARFIFEALNDFAANQPSQVQMPLQRAALPALNSPGYDRSYRYQQYFAFAQDTFKLSSRLTLNYGLRYELYTGPVNAGEVKDLLIRPGSGSTLTQQLASATLPQPAAGDQKLFGTDPADFGVRAGASFDLTGRGQTVLRAAYGIFFDRPYDNLWENLRNNNIVLATLKAPYQVDYLAPPKTLLPLFSQGSVINSNFPDLTMVDPNLRNGRVHSYFAGVQHRVSDQFTLEANGLGSYGRQLISSDLVNRTYSVGSQRYNPNLSDIAYRSSQGFSDYNALAVTVRYRTSSAALQATYTWSHTIDNQSDALSGDFFNLSFAQVPGPGASQRRAAFSRQFDPKADRAGSDFDQRHNFVVYSYWDAPALFAGSRAGFLFRNWSFSGLAATRSGFPFSLIGSTDVAISNSYILNNRPDLVDPSNVYANQKVAGGRKLLNKDAFRNAAPGELGNTGRNAFAGPGFYNLDAALMRSFSLRWLGEAGRLRLRVDAFNLLNHTNLNAPDNNLNNPTFGVATYGRQESASSGFPAVSPLNESPRQLQLSVKIDF